MYGADTEKAWRVEGQKLVTASSPKLVAHHAGHLSQAITAALATSALAGLQHGQNDDVAAAPTRLQNALRLVMGQNPAVAKTLPDVKRHSKKSPSNSGAICSETSGIKSVAFTTTTTTHDSQSSSGSTRQEVACKDEPATMATYQGVPPPQNGRQEAVESKWSPSITTTLPC